MSAMISRLVARVESRRQESGATAVLFAILVALLFSMAALGVDLGNAWARTRNVQKQADVSALSVGHLLPKTSGNLSEIRKAAADYLNKNLATGQQAVNPAQLTNADQSDGEVTFQDSAGAACVEECTRMTLFPPAAQVDFGFAALMGFTGTQVQRAAVVEISSELPPKENLLPLWLPFGCGYGPVHGDTSQGGGPSGPSDPVATASPSPSPSGVAITPVGSHTLVSTYNPFTVALNERRTIGFFTIQGIPTNTKKASLRFVKPDGSGYIETTAHDPKKIMGFQVPEFEIGPSGTVGATSITDVPGEWRVYAMVQPNGNGDPEYSSNFVTVQVGDPSTPPPPSPTVDPTTPPQAASIPVGCVGQDRGNFGQLLSPREGVSGRAETMKLNMSLGLDHNLVPFEWGTQSPTDSCAHSNGNNPIPGAQLDSVSRDGNNCIISDTGNDGPAMYDGLIGNAAAPGRLSASNGATTCSGRSDAVINGHPVNNDVLSCFLRPTYTLNHISADSGVTTEMLDPAVKDSPRFVWLPLVQATDRSEKGYQPMIDFVPAFITDETFGVPATATNGLDIHGNSIKDVQLYAFSKDALPVDERSPVTDYNPEFGRAVLHLVG